MNNASLRRPKICLLACGGLVLGLVACLVSLSVGAVSIPGQHVLLILVLGQHDLAVHGVPEWQQTIVMSLRLPRTLLAWLVGSALSLSGCALQGLFLNPLAEPGVLGVSSSAALGALGAILLGLVARSELALPLAACVGAGVATLALTLVAARPTRSGPGRLLLAGLAINNLAGAGTALLVSLALADHEATRQIVGWSLGSLEGTTWKHLAWAVGPVGLGMVAVLVEARNLDALLLSERGALAVGVDVEGLRRRLVLVTSVLSGVSVAIAGTIGFVGLVVPHLARQLVGALHRRLLTASLLGGGTFLVLADVVARRVIAPEELRLGVVTAAIGAPVFLCLLLRQRRENSA